MHWQDPWEGAAYRRTDYRLVESIGQLVGQPTWLRTFFSFQAFPSFVTISMRIVAQLQLRVQDPSAADLGDARRMVVGLTACDRYGVDLGRSRSLSDRNCQTRGSR
jgi:hypothetical protein